MKARWALSLPQTSRANPVQCCSTHQKKKIQSQDPHPPGGVLYLLCSLIRNPEEEDPPRSTWYKLFEGGPLPPGSWSGNIVKPPRGGVVLSIRLYTGWRRHIGYLKLQVIFRKRATNHRALLQRMSCKDKASYDSMPPCTKPLLTCTQTF